MVETILMTGRWTRRLQRRNTALSAVGMRQTTETRTLQIAAFRYLTSWGVLTIFHGSFELVAHLRINTSIYGQAEGTVRCEIRAEIRKAFCCQTPSPREEISRATDSRFSLFRFT